MAAVPTGPSSAMPASPAEITPFPGGGSDEPGEEEESGCGREGTITSGAGQEHQVSENKRPNKKKQKNMLSHANPTAAILLKSAPQEQQLNGLVGPSSDEDVNHSNKHTEHRPDNPRPSTEHCDISSEGIPSDKNNSDHCHHEDHSPCSKNSSHPHMNNNSMNGMMTITRTEAIQSHPVTGDHPGNVRKEECDPTEPPRPPGEPPDHEGLEAPRARVDTDPTQHQPPVSELARLDLNCSPGRGEEDSQGIHYVRYESELQMPGIMRLITKDLSEPYSIYTYRYFIHNWPQLCFLVSITYLQENT